MAQTYENWGQGPIELSDQYFFSLLHLGFRPMSTEVMDEGKNSFRLSEAWSNTAIRKKDRYIVDVESVVSTLDWKYGFSENLEIGVRVPVIWRGGGVLDSGIDSVHSFLGLPQGDRDRLEDNSYTVSGKNSNGNTFDFGKQGTELGNVVLESKYLLTKGDMNIPAFTLFSSISLPTAADSYGHESFDFQFAGLLSQRFGDFIAYTGSALTYYEEPDVSGVNYSRFNVEVFSTLEYLWTKSLSLQVGILSSLTERVKIVDHPDYTFYLDLGVKYIVAQNTGVEFLMRQNPDPGDGTADVTFMLNLRYAI